MRHIASNTDVPHSQAEICLNLWYFFDESGIVLRLAGKAYALVGTDEQKLEALHLIAGCDHLTATQDQVPPTFLLNSAQGKLKGVLVAADVFMYHAALFGPLMNKIEHEFPKGIRSVNMNYEQFVQKLPQDPLCVTTGVFESPDGELVSRVHKNE